jgi:hypothetical protein
VPIDPRSLGVGHCYRLSDGWRCRVTVIEASTVRFELLEGGTASATREEFAGKVQAEIDCPEPARTTPSQAEDEG